MQSTTNGTGYNTISSPMAAPPASPKGRSRAKSQTTTPKPAKGKRKPSKRTWSKWLSSLSPQRQVALGVGTVGTTVLGLSLWHCTETLSMLNGSPLFLAGPMAVGIDAGMVVCEVAAMASGNQKTQQWAHGVVIGVAVASSALNAIAALQHAPAGYGVIAAVLNGLIPALVFALAKVAGLLWKE